MKGKSILFTPRVKSASGNISFMPKNGQKSLFAKYIANRHDIDPNGALDIIAHGSWREIEVNTSKISDEKIIIIINHNLACAYQKQKNTLKCLFYLEKVAFDFDTLLSKKHKINIEINEFLDNILTEEINSNKILGDFILELRFCAKFHLQMCAAYSQNGDHKKALMHAKLASVICQDNIRKTFLLYEKIRDDIRLSPLNNSKEQYSSIFIQKLNENEHIINSLNDYVLEIANTFNEPKDRRLLSIEKIKELISNKENKISNRNVLGIIKNDDWLNLFNIGNIMYLCGMLYEDLDLDSDNKYELLRDAIIEKILMLTVSFF